MAQPYAAKKTGGSVGDVLGLLLLLARVSVISRLHYGKGSLSFRLSPPTPLLKNKENS